MKKSIRLFNKKDFETIKSWWIESLETPPLIEMLPEESTFVLEIDGVPKVCIAVYLTNTNYIALLENFAKDPKFKDSHDSTRDLVIHAEDFCKKAGFKIITCLSYKDKLKNRYQELGYINTLNNLSSFAKIVKEL